MEKSVAQVRSEFQNLLVRETSSSHQLHHIISGQFDDILVAERYDNKLGWPAACKFALYATGKPTHVRTTRCAQTHKGQKQQHKDPIAHPMNSGSCSLFIQATTS